VSEVQEHDTIFTFSAFILCDETINVRFSYKMLKYTTYLNHWFQQNKTP